MTNLLLLLSHFSRVWLLVTPWTAGHQGSSVHGIFQARILEWDAIAFSDDQPRQHIKKQRYYFANKGPSSQSYGFPSSHVWMWGLDYKESWAPKNWCFWTVVLEKTLESPLDCKEIQPVHPKGDQSCICTGRTDAEAPILWPPDSKNWLIGKDPNAGKDWRWEEKGTTKDEMVGWHHQLDGHEFEQAPGVGDGQGSLVCCSLWGHKESDTTEEVNWSKGNVTKEEMQMYKNISESVLLLTASENKLSVPQHICWSSKAFM